MSERVLAIGSGWSRLGAPHAVMPAIWLAHRGFDVEYLGFGTPGENAIESPLGRLPAVTLGNGRVLKHARLIRCILGRRFSRSPPDRYLVLGSPATLAARMALAGIPSSRITYLTQDYLEPGVHRFWRRCERKLASRAGAVISNEAHRARFMASDYRLRRVPEVVRTAYPSAWPAVTRDPDLRADLLAALPASRRERAFVVMAGGPFAVERCGPEVVAALRSLPDDHVVVFTASTPGDPAWKLAKEAAARAGIGERVALLPRLSHERMLGIAAWCDAGLLLYRNDGLGNFCQCPGRLGEYLLCGVPAVASDFPSLALPFLRWGLGATCDPSSPSSIAAAIMTLSAKPAAERERERIRLRDLARDALSYDAGGAVLEAAVRGERA